MDMARRRRPSSRRAAGAATILGLALSACGGNGELAEGQVEGGVPLDELEQAAVATEGDLDCPAKVRKDLAGPDIVGLKLGMTLDEAMGTARCALGADAQVKTEQRWLDRMDTYGVELGTQFFEVRQGEHRPCNYAREWQECESELKWGHVDEVVSVATPGVPGKEAAMAIWRKQAFREGQMPSAQALVDALVAKYGEPQVVDESDRQRGYSAGYRELQWLQDGRGAPLSDPNPLFGQCRGAIHRAEDSVRWRDGCGLTIRAQVLLSGQNPGLAMELHTAMLQQSTMHAHVDALQSELQQLGQARREAEVQQAGDASDVRL